MSFQIFSVDNPDYLKKILPLFRGGERLTALELSQSVDSLGLSMHPRRSRHLLQIWYVLGFMERRKENGGAFRYQLSSFGTELLNHLSFNESLAIELGHLAWYSAWLRAPDFERAWSWLYFDICNLLWERSPSIIVPKQLTADAVERAAAKYPDELPALDTLSINSVLMWLTALEPSFLNRGQEKGYWSSQLRDSCSPELMYLAIQLQYSIRELSLGSSILIDDEFISSVCRTCLLSSQSFWPLVEICDLTFSTLAKKETAYGTSIIVYDTATFTPPIPRSTRTQSRC